MTVEKWRRGDVWVVGIKDHEELDRSKDEGVANSLVEFWQGVHDRVRWAKEATANVVSSTKK